MQKKMIEISSNHCAGRRTEECGGLRSERGIALILALVMLALLAMLGIFALGTSSTSLHIAGNYRNHELAFYNADMGEAFGPLNPNIAGGVNPYVVNSASGTPVTNAYLGQTQVTVQFLCVSLGRVPNTHEIHYKVTIIGTGANNSLFTTVSQIRRTVSPKVKEYENREDC